MANDEFDFLMPMHDDQLNELGRQQQQITDVLPTPAQTRSAIFQAGCLMHCGMGLGLYSRVFTDDGTLMQDALAIWYEQLTPGAAELPLDQRLWVDKADYIEADGSCWGYADLWVSLFRSVFLMWLLWAVHLTQTLRGGTDVNTAWQYGAIFLAKKIGKVESLPVVWGARENGLCWGVVWLVLLLGMIASH